MRRILFIPLLLLFTTLLTACNSMPLSQRSDVLKNDLRRYEGTIRWDNIANAYKMMTPDLQKTVPVPGNLDNIKVTHYEVLGGVKVKDDRAEQRVTIRYIHKDRQVVRQLIDNQIWVDLPNLGWRRDNPIPIFK